MNCRSVRNLLSAYLDGQLAGEAKRILSQHLSNCRDCTSESATIQNMRRALRNLPARVPPEHLTDSLRVIASRDRARRIVFQSPEAFVSHYTARLRLWLDNLMRPLALPLAGGIASAIVLFGMLFPSFALRVNHGPDDVPIAIFTQPAISSIAPFAVDDDLIVEVSLDGQGRMIDYTVAQGTRLGNNSELRRSIENSLLFTGFTPATAFGQPTPSKMFVSFTRSQINIKS